MYSATSKNKAESTVAKLFANVLPGADYAKSTASSNLASAQQLASLVKHKPSAITKKSTKKTINQKIKKASEKDKKFRKMIKYNIINNHEDPSIEEQKYLAKLRKKNINQLNNLSNIDDEGISHDLEEVRTALIEQVGAKQKKRLRKRKLVTSNNQKFDDFNAKVKKGFISYPGLTPGLAPVDYNESDSEWSGSGLFPSVYNIL